MFGGHVLLKIDLLEKERICHIFRINAKLILAEFSTLEMYVSILKKDDV